MVAPFLINWCYSRLVPSHGPLARYVKLRVAHASGMPRSFSPPPISKETASYRFRHSSQHVHHARNIIEELSYHANEWLSGTQSSRQFQRNAQNRCPGKYWDKSLSLNVWILDIERQKCCKEESLALSWQFVTWASSWYLKITSNSTVCSTVCSG